MAKNIIQDDYFLNKQWYNKNMENLDDYQKNSPNMTKSEAEEFDIQQRIIGLVYLSNAEYNCNQSREIMYLKEYIDTINSLDDHDNNTAKAVVDKIIASNKSIELKESLDFNPLTKLISYESIRFAILKYQLELKGSQNEVEITKVLQILEECSNQDYQSSIIGENE